MHRRPELDDGESSGGLALPAPPTDSPRAGFPLLAVCAPIAGAVALWAITGSIVSLAFAALGPIVAVASLLDGRRAARRTARRDARRRHRAHDELGREIDQHHALERAAAWRRTPSAREVVERGASAGWHAADPGCIVIGEGATASALRIEGRPVDDDDRAALTTAARLADAPVLADPATGIAFVGPTSLARAAARAAVVQCAERMSPADLRVIAPDGAEWDWARRLPHHGSSTLRIAEHGDVHGWIPDAGYRIAVARWESEVPGGIRTIVRVVEPRRAEVERRGSGQVGQSVVPHLIGAAECATWAEQARAAAASAGLLGDDDVLPTRVPLVIGTSASQDRSRTTLRVGVGVSAGGPLELDLVSGGPHALVAGTTGSGKSEFLLAWLCALAATYPADRVAFLLVDFKGGAAFEPIRDLPHVTGIVTDLDDLAAERAVESLRAELRRREQALLEAGVRDIGDLADAVPLARLVVVIDEFQAMIERFPSLGVVVSDIAARGRSLGVHLVLSSQRPNGVVREQVTANCAIRISLRVMQAADSLAVVGTDLAARIPAGVPGRGIVDRGDGFAVPFQSAIAAPDAVRRLTTHLAEMPKARRPWLDPLPAQVTRSQLPSVERALEGSTPAYAFGVLDEPERQRRTAATWLPDRDGHLLVLGMPGSGRTTALTALADAVAEVDGRNAILELGGARSHVWDTLERLAQGDTAGVRLLLVDDVDQVFRGWPDEYRLAALDRLERVMVEGRQSGVIVAASALRASGLGAGVRDSFGAAVLLRHASRTDVLHAGGAGDLWRNDDPPGAGQWRGRRLQVVQASTRPARVDVASQQFDLVPGRIHAVVTPAPQAVAARFEERFGIRPVHLHAGAAHAAESAIEPGSTNVIVGDAEAWNAAWSLQSRIREDAVVVVWGGRTEYRALVRDPGLPPILDDPRAECWVLEPGADGAVRRRWST